MILKRELAACAMWQYVDRDKLKTLHIFSNIVHLAGNVKEMLSINKQGGEL